MYVTFQEERLGVRLLPEVGADNAMWASDYPHPDSTFPNSYAHPTLTSSRHYFYRNPFNRPPSSPYCIAPPM